MSDLPSHLLCRMLLTYEVRRSQSRTRGTENADDSVGEMAKRNGKPKKNAYLRYVINQMRRSISLRWLNRCVIGPFRDLNSIYCHLRRLIAIVSVQGPSSRRFPVILKITTSSHRSRWQQAIRFINNSLMSLRACKLLIGLPREP